MYSGWNLTGLKLWIGICGCERESIAEDLCVGSSTTKAILHSATMQTSLCFSIFSIYLNHSQLDRDTWVPVYSSHTSLWFPKID
jgi:hypothetical protein